MGETGIRAFIRSIFYRTLWTIGRKYCDSRECVYVVASGHGHHAWWHRP